MVFLASDVEVVYASGRAVAAQSTAATELAGAYLRSLEEAAMWATHPTMVAGIERYHGTWQPVVTEVALRIDALGADTSGSATDVAGADGDANGLLGRTGVEQQHRTGWLNRPI